MGETGGAGGGGDGEKEVVGGVVLVHDSEVGEEGVVGEDGGE